MKRWGDVIPPEYRAGFDCLKNRIGLRSALQVALAAGLRSLQMPLYAVSTDDPSDVRKLALKNHFKLPAALRGVLIARCGRERTAAIMRDMLMQGGKAFLRGFAPLGPRDNLLDFAGNYRAFERKNVVFDVLEESPLRFEIEIRRCLVYEVFQELGLGELSGWMCDVATDYFSTYDFRISYNKDRMIARGDTSCHEVFVWEQMQPAP
jgi:hypothetical protein